MGKAQSPARSGTSPSRGVRLQRLVSCQKCESCKKENCGKCINCKDMIMFGGPGVRKSKCLLRICENKRATCITPKKQSPLSVTKGKHEKSEVVVKDYKSEKYVNKGKSTFTSTDGNRGVLVPKSPKKASQYFGSSQSSPRVKADISVKAQTSPKVQTSFKPKPTADILKTPQVIGKNCPENKPARNSPRIQSVSPARTSTCNQQGRTMTSYSSKDVRTSISSKENAAPIGSGSSLSENASTVTVRPDIDLPAVELDSMSKADLKEFIPKLLKLVTGKEEVFYSRRSAKPEWWPEDVVWAASRTAWFSEKYWTDNLRSIVKNCYRHVGKEDLLCTLVDDSTFNPRYSKCIHEQDAQNEDTVKTGSYPSSPVKIRMFPQDLFLPFSAEIYICYFCEKEFLSKERMHSHQKECTERPPDLQNMYKCVSPHDSGSSVQIPTMSPKNVVVKNWSKLSLDKFSQHLSLVPKDTAAKLREQRLSIEEVNCEILDDTEPVSPVTPKTPKSLISQLSREDSGLGSRKRLSYSLSMESHKDVIIEEADSDSDDSAESEQKNKVVHENNFLDIPISSLLGQRIKNYVHVDTPMSIVEDTGSYCRTPVKNTFLEKLRKKPLAYPLLYRPRRIANLHKQNHIYKFKRTEVKNFMSKINTGLSLTSLEKLKSMKKFTVRVRRLSRKKLLNWIPRRKLDKLLRGAFKGLKYNPYSDYDEVECEFPSGPTLLAKNIDKLLGLKKRSSQDNANMSMKNTLSLSNFISEEMEAEISKQKLTLYRSLLYEMSVLKPAVVMEDIGSRVKEDSQDKKQSGCKTSTKVDDDLKDKEVKPKSVLRDMLRKSKEERLMAEAKERERKEDYQILQSLLTAPKTPENIKFLTKHRHGKTTPTSLDVYGVKHDQRSPNDDSVSILSASSEGESLHSNCCQGCCDKKNNVSKQTFAVAHNVVPSPTVTPQLIQPLHVDVDLSTMKIDEYGIPSPMSISSESPYLPTPNKSSSSLQDHSGSNGDESVESTPVIKREMRTTRSSGTASPSANNESSVFSLISSRSHDKINLSSVSDSLIKNSMRRVQSEGIQTRSCSNTPNGSPVKRLTRSGSSAPVSPTKVLKQSRLPLDVKQVSKNLEGPALMQTSNIDLKFKPRQTGMSVSDIEKCDSLDSSNLSPLLVSASKQQSLGSGLLAKNNQDKNTGLSASPLRRSKRRSSFMSEGGQATKLRKVYSDMGFTSRY